MNFMTMTTALLVPTVVQGFAVHQRNVRPTSTVPLHVSFSDNMVSVDGQFDDFGSSRKQQQQQQQKERRRREIPRNNDENDVECPVRPSNIPPGMILSWETQVEDLIRCEVMKRAEVKATTSNQPYMIGVVGIPGSGKSTSCAILTSMLSDLGCLLMPFDGYHYPVDELLAMENPDDLIYRRGAPDTFNVSALKRDLETIRFGDESMVSVPGFDHARGDPEPNAHRFHRDEHNIVITEGLYLLHDDAGWETVKNYFDMTIFVHADVDMCVERLKIRNKCIPGYTPEEIELRCEVVDRTNAMTVEYSKAHADIVVHSAATTRR
eukprot:CAMPEP_0119546348 /NCGR_PEP_ID=MMETSP1352-20130426/810_1 /TAXON_ID=265584 /ORGANISM="Stauroneis constricta, Strain CCMP1120" /LENGTH=321 /DNA_ID=CAMNT_0007591045 /DNA_START=73 /DNA_END=1038 /DNA_ORIENTATION=+